MAKLFVVATPIGNLEDISFRAVRVLGQVDVCFAEDTRRTRKLFSHYNIHTDLVSCYRQNEQRRVESIITLLDAGKSVALVSDAGMPGISDPGEMIIRSLIELGYPIEIIPGASSVLTAVLLSGLRTDQFAFFGFIPRKGNKRNKRLRQIEQYCASVIVFESPFRIESLLTDFLQVCGNRTVALCRELTKLFESVERGSVTDILDRLKQKKIPLKGEFVIVFEGKEAYEKKNIRRD